MTTASEAVVQAAQQLSPPELDDVVGRLLLLRTRHAIERSQASDEELVRLIREAVPEVLLRRTRRLQRKRRAETLTEAERAELIRLSDLIEGLNADRVLYLAQLAHRRREPITEVMTDLGLRPSRPM